MRAQAAALVETEAATALASSCSAGADGGEERRRLRCGHTRGSAQQRAPEAAAAADASSATTGSTMPRAFLITHRRYNTIVEYEYRGVSPERSVSVGESRAPQPLPWAASGLVAEVPVKAETPLAAAVGTSGAESGVAPALTEARSPTPTASHNAPGPLPPPQCEKVDHSQATYVPAPPAAPVLVPQIPESPLLVDEEAEALYNLTQLAEVSVAAAAGTLGPLLAHGCVECGKRYSTASNLARHRQTHRSPADKKARRCPHCDKVYVSMPAFSMHVRTHNQGCKCPYCGKCFSRPWLLQGHIRTHTGEKPFKCTICNKAFADKSNLRAHVQTHSSTKPHVCARCGKAFALKSYLYKHEESSCVRAQSGGGGGNAEVRPATINAGSPLAGGSSPRALPPPLGAAHAAPPPLSFAITA